MATIHSAAAGSVGNLAEQVCPSTIRRARQLPDGRRSPPRSPPSTGLNHHATNGRACVTIGYDLSRNPGHQIVLNLPFAPTGHGHLGRAAIHAASSTLSTSVGDTFDDAGRLAALQLVGLGLVTMNE